MVLKIDSKMYKQSCRYNFYSSSIFLWVAFSFRFPFLWSLYHSFYGQWPVNDRRDCTFFHHYQGSIDFNTVNIHRTIGMYFLVSTGNRGDIEWLDLQRSYYPIHSLLPGVYVSILSLGTVLIRTPLGAWMWLDIMITVDHFIQYHSCCQWIQTNTSLQWDEYWQC